MLRIIFFIAGRQDYGVVDLREKIGRRRSPIHRHSPGRDARVSLGHNCIIYLFFVL